MKLTLIAGARPNFMKIAPIIRELEKRKEEGLDINYRLVHTGQHYDPALSASFFSDLGIPEPGINLEAGSGSHAEQTAQIMLGIEKDLLNHTPDILVVVGDVNSTLACSIVAKKLGILVAHVEGGIRSGDLGMPEEINRKVTDSISDFFFTTTTSAGENLVAEGVDPSKIFLVGNTMIDTLVFQQEHFNAPEFRNAKRDFLLLTLHRPTNVDDPMKLEKLLNEIVRGAGEVPLVFPVHPRTKKSLDRIKDLPDIEFLNPLGYNQFLYLVKNSLGVVTDSGGIQEETTYLGVPCLTLRSTTERPETVEIGTNVLVGQEWDRVQEYVRTMAKGNWKQGRIPKHWDGKTAERVIEKIVSILK